jgi:hypothetical protein
VHVNIENAMQRGTKTTSHYGIKLGQLERNMLCNVGKRYIE